MLFLSKLPAFHLLTTIVSPYLQSGFTLKPWGDSPELTLFLLRFQSSLLPFWAAASLCVFDFQCVNRSMRIILVLALATRFYTMFASQFIYSLFLFSHICHIFLPELFPLLALIIDPSFIIPFCLE